MKESKPYENKGRKLMIEFLNQSNPKEIIPTEEEFNPVDLLVTTKRDSKLAVEIKVRDPYVENFDTYILEEVKWQGMLEKKAEYNMEYLVYGLFFGENTLYVFMPETFVPNMKTEIRKLPKTTAIAGAYVDTPCYMLPKSKGQKFIKVNGEWIKSAS